MTVANEAKQALARLAVEAVDALPQPPDRLDEVVALGGELGVLRLDFAQFLLGEQIDRAEPFALAADAVELGFDFGDLRQFGVRL